MCDTDPHLRGPGADHVPILTTIDLSVPCLPQAAPHNFRVVDWAAFREHLEAALSELPPAALLTSRASFHSAVSSLTEVLQATIGMQVPPTRPSPYSKRWWSKRLSDLKKQKNKLSSLSYRYRALPEHHSHDEHRRVRNLYSDEIWKVK